MNADQFQDLYKMLRGSRSALLVLDARALFLEKKLSASLKKLQEARDLFMESRTRVLKQTPERQLDPKARDADQQLKKFKRKQDKTHVALDHFNEMIPQLEKLTERDQKRREVADERERALEVISEPDSVEVSHVGPEVSIAVPRTTSATSFARTCDLTSDIIDILASSPADQRLDVINKYFGFREVQSADDLHGESLYYIQTPKASLLVCTPRLEDMSLTVQLVDPIDSRAIKPFSREAFLKLGRDRNMVLLTQRDQTEQTEQTEQTDMVAAGVLDAGAFSQLLTSAQRSGLVPDADQIGFVRDREFRMGKFDLAFQAIDSLYARFMASSGQRSQRLAREDAEIAAGRIQISPKDLQAKRTRDRNETQEIERAKRRFQVVLEGLRVLINVSS